MMGPETQSSAIVIDAPPPADVNGGDISMADGTEPTLAPGQLPSDACETLYIQNLNESVKVDGDSHLLSTSHLPLDHVTLLILLR